ncbi:replication protein RepR, partial [Enterococcus faecium]
FKIKPGRNGGIQLASVKSLLLSIIKLKKEERESYIKALTASFNLERTFIQETLNKLAERPKTDTQLDLFSYDTG